MTDKQKKRELIQRLSEKLDVPKDVSKQKKREQPKTINVAPEVRKDYVKSLTRQLDILFEDFDAELFIEIRGLNGEPRYFFENTAVNREKYANKVVLQTDLAVGINPRIVQKGTADAVLEARFLVLDFDRKDKSQELKMTYQDILKELEVYNLRPRLIVSSGNGYHVYLKLDRVISAIDFTKFQTALIKFANEKIASKFENVEVDDAIKDPPRLIRLVSTINSKNNAIAQIVYEDEAITNVDELCKLLPFEQENAHTQHVMSEPTSSDELQALIENVKAKFIEGQRQFLTFGLAGVLAKMGYSEEEALRIYHEHFAPIDSSEDLRMREACIKRTYKLYKAGQTIAGASVLKEYGVELPFKRNHRDVQLQIEDPSNKMLVINDEEMETLQFEKRKPVVENLIPIGVSILAGKSKLGKSWFSLFVAYHVASNTPLWGTFAVNNRNKGVCYLALEDYPERIQARRQKMLPNLTLNGSTKTLQFRFNQRGYQFKLNDEGYRELDKIAKEACLIIIDTYVRAKIPKNYKNEYEYESDVVSRLQSIAFENDTAILLVHHTRKMYSEDVFDNILGSTALPGVADANMVFERLRKQDLIKLHITSREFDTQTYALRFDKEKAIFTFEGNAELYELSELQREVLEILKSQKLTFTELKNILRKSDSTIHYTLQKLIAEDLVEVEQRYNRTFYFAKNKTGGV